MCTDAFQITNQCNFTVYITEIIHGQKRTEENYFRTDVSSPQHLCQEEILHDTVSSTAKQQKHNTGLPTYFLLK